MLNLLKIEYSKVKNYSTFWVIIGIYGLLVPLGFLGICGLISQILSPFGIATDYSSFPDIWKYISWTSSWWNFLLGILIIILSCNEISFKTQRQNIIDGMSRKQVITSKFLMIVTLALVVSIYTAIVGFLFGFFASGFNEVFKGFSSIGIYFLQTIGYFSIAYLFAVIFRKSALAIIFFILIWIINLFLSGAFEWIQFWPIDVISGLNPNPFFDGFVQLETAQDENFTAPWVMSMAIRLGLGVFYICGFFFVGFLFVRKKDL